MKTDVQLMREVMALPHGRHIRARLRPLGGNSFYRDKNERTSTTLCGASVTDRDITFNDARFGKHALSTEFPVCQACKDLYNNPKRNW